MSSFLRSFRATNHVTRFQGSNSFNPSLIRNPNVFRRLNTPYTPQQRLFCGTKPIKPKSAFRKWLKRGFLGTAGLLTTLCGALYIKHRDEKNVRRSMKFWWHVYPLYFHYKVSYLLVFIYFIALIVYSENHSQ